MQMKGDANPTKVWFFGFTKELPRSVLRKFITDSIMAKVPSANGRFVPKAFDLEKKASVTFETPFLAQMFCELCQDEGAITHNGSPIRVQMDRSQATRARNRLIGKLREQCEFKLDLRNGRYQVGSNNPKGKVFVHDESSGDLWVLFIIRALDDGKVAVDMDEEVIKTCGLDPDIAKAMIQDAEEQCGQSRSVGR